MQHQEKAKQSNLINSSTSSIVGNSGALRHSVGVFQLIFGTQYFCLYGSLDESMLKIIV